MDKAKVVSIPLATHFKLSHKQCPSTEKDLKDMEKVPYASAVGLGLNWHQSKKFRAELAQKKFRTKLTLM